MPEREHPSRRRYHARRRLLIERGQWQPLADAAPVREHARKLQQAGMSGAQIAVKARLSKHVVSHLIYGERERISPQTAAAILAVELPPARPARTGQEPAVASARRLQALAVLGWSPPVLAGRLGMYPASVRRIRDGERDDVETATAAAITALYRELWNQVPPAATKAERIAAGKVSRHAARSGWVPAAAWDDDEIDDPAATPADGWERGEGRERGTLAAETLDLIALGLDLGQAAERLGVDKSTLSTTLARVRAKETADAA